MKDLVYILVIGLLAFVVNAQSPLDAPDTELGELQNQLAIMSANYSEAQEQNRALSEELMYLNEQLEMCQQ